MVTSTGYTNLNEHSRGSSRKRRCRIGGEGAQASDETDFVNVRIGEALLACGREGSGVDTEGKGAETGSQDDCQFWVKGVSEEAKIRCLWSSNPVRV